jgi:tetratricopeptide (TPR) repeat protein
MAFAPLQCCGVESSYERMRPFPPEQDTTFMTWWRCPVCRQLSGDLGSTGPIDASARAAVQPVPADLVAAAREAWERGLARRAFALLELALEKDPANAAAWAEKGRLLFHASLPAKAVTQLEKAVALGNKAPEVTGYLGMALSDTPRAPEALPLLAAAVAAEPSSGRWRHGLARLLVRLGKIDEAAQAIDAGLAMNPEPMWRGGLLTERANVCCARRDGEAALVAADEALSLAPANSYAHYVRGRALGMLGRLAEGIAVMDGLLAMVPGDPDATRAKAAFTAALRR